MSSRKIWDECAGLPLTVSVHPVVAPAGDHRLVGIAGAVLEPEGDVGAAGGVDQRFAGQVSAARPNPPRRRS